MSTIGTEEEGGNNISSIGKAEHIKENIRPLETGNELRTLLHSLKRESSSTRTKPLTPTKRILEESSDPLQDFYLYLKYLQNLQPSGHPDFIKWLEKVVRTFKHDARYKNDRRYLWVWLNVASRTKEPRDVFKYMSMNEFGTGLPAYYEQYSKYLETIQKYDEAKEILKLGINRGVQRSRLEARLAELEMRIISYKFNPYSECINREANAKSVLNTIKVPSENDQRSSSKQSSIRKIQQCGQSIELYKERSFGKYCTQLSLQPNSESLLNGENSGSTKSKDSFSGTFKWRDLKIAQRRSIFEQNENRIYVYRDEEGNSDIKKDAEEKAGVTSENPTNKIIQKQESFSKPGDFTTHLSRSRSYLSKSNDKKERLFCNAKLFHRPPGNVNHRHYIECSFEELRAEDYDKKNKAVENKYISPLKTPKKDNYLYPKQSPTINNKKVFHDVQISARPINPDKEYNKQSTKNEENTRIEDSFNCLDSYLKTCSNIDEALTDNGKRPRKTHLEDENSCILLDHKGLFEKNEDLNYYKPKTDYSRPPHSPKGHVLAPCSSTSSSSFGNSKNESPSEAVRRNSLIIENKESNIPQYWNEINPQYDRQLDSPKIKKYELYDTSSSSSYLSDQKIPTYEFTDKVESGCKEKTQRTITQDHTINLNIQSELPIPDIGSERLMFDKLDTYNLGKYSLSQKEPEKYIPKLSNSTTCKPLNLCSASFLFRLTSKVDLDDVQCLHVLKDIKTGINRSLRHSLNAPKNSKMFPAIINIPRTGKIEVVKQIGEGGFGKAYLVNLDPHSQFLGSNLKESTSSKNTRNDSNKTCAALKIIQDTNPWEYIVLNRLKSRLSVDDFKTIVDPWSCYVFESETLLFMEYKKCRTLLECANIIHNDKLKPGPIPGFSEVLVSLWTIEILRIVEVIHMANVIHRDIKADNFLLHLKVLESRIIEDIPQENFELAYKNCWGPNGLMLIDWGSAIDLSVFDKNQKFYIPNANASAKASCKDEGIECWEARNGKEWRYECDWYGAAGVIHVLIFGRYMEIVEKRNENSIRPTLEIKSSLKRGWQTEIWKKLFYVLLNSGKLNEDILNNKKTIFSPLLNQDNKRLSSLVPEFPAILYIHSIRLELENWLYGNFPKGVKHIQNFLRNLTAIYDMSDRN